MVKSLFCLFLSFFLVTEIQAQIQIQLEKNGGVYYIPCNVNGIPLKMIFDTGASVVTISLKEARAMIYNQTLTRSEVLGPSNFRTASGDIVEGTMVVLRSIEIGDMVLRNVRASVVHSMNAPLLLGQTVLSLLGNVNIDFAQNVLTIAPNRNSSGGLTKEIDLEQAKPMDGLFKYSTSIKNGQFDIPIFAIRNGEWRIIYRIPRYTDVYVIDDSNYLFSRVNVNGFVGYVPKEFLNPHQY